ncbi:Fumarate reductase/succinate dehydrogenase flavoprotein domain-containing protein [Azotobacter chroococcum NCIMB 8003]|uniref:Fumarate reductase/succinate dehydrogenase flavoprotein domain-containing protein n=1 Tax=Azotobacter chroococcum NCIMB 8003 TaxID=1328314 RepID=A0A0C4WU18_9GAMM|nr:Fumarate reductase/succinate dehydrogenase flavoprotein domain-containing protein [Azotobacter chroococcum NCIMB 8003]
MDPRQRSGAGGRHPCPGRALEIAEYDGRRLGARFKDLRRPPDGMLLFGGMMVNRVDIQHFLGIKSSPKSLWHCLKLMARYGVDRLSHPRGTRLTVGNALIARLASTAFAAAPQAATYRPKTDAEHWSMSPETNVGDGLSLAAAVNAATGEDLAASFFWAPVSVLRKPDGSLERFPHLVTDRAKPGVIAVNRAGRRFVNESDSYHSFVEAMFADGGANAPCWLICDAEAMNRYGMGLARPRPVDNTALIEAGYLHRADSIAGLARRIGVDAAGLQQTLERYNADAREHVDREFGKGGNAYNRYMGDPLHTPNPCIAPLNKAPYYAIKIGTGDLGSARGLLTDAQANVLDRAGQPVAGLYAAGNEMNSIMDGTYPGPGITLGPGLTFGYLAACDIAGRLSGTTSQATPPGDEHVLRTAHLHH